MNWTDLSRESLDAARFLYRSGMHRSAASRAYYALFSAVTARLPQRAIPPRMTAPKHRDLPRLIDEHFGWLRWHQREAVKAAARRTYATRLEADYSTARQVDAAMAKQAIQNALGVLRRLGVKPGV